MEKVQLTDGQKANVLRVMFENLEDLKTLQNPLELHAVASNWNWDDGCELLTWIVCNPICEKGTALLLYWRAGPRWFYQFSNRDEISKYELPIYDLIKEIETRYISGFYKESTIAFDPKNDEETDWTIAYSKINPKQEIPALMKIPISGILIDRSFAS